MSLGTRLHLGNAKRTGPGSPTVKNAGPVERGVGAISPDKQLTEATPRKYAFSPCEDFHFESAVSEQNDEFKGSPHVRRFWTPRKYVFDVTSVGQRKYVFDVTSVGQRSSPWTCKLSESRDKIPSRVQAPFLTLSLPRVINFKFPLQPHQKYNITQYGELGFSWLPQMTDDHTTTSRQLTCTFLFKKVGRLCFLSLGVKGLTHECNCVTRRMPNSIVNPFTP